MSDTQDPIAAAKALRREILGDAYVNAAAENTASDSTSAEFQEFITTVAWTVWTRPNLAPRDRSLMVMAMTAALGRMEEFKLHARSSARAGLTPPEVDEVVFQVAAYAGAPAGIAARRALRQVRDESSDE